ncbi:MAG TPA: coproporphyrinogen III oxidase [Elusimicrobia bacterium]|nr:MAG: hypothetical protein A2278_03250 [Elusimicrobia bacterium RIFOXYA12_FULL_49_49]OGS08552.1 MAG: hypothetical protein A2204_02820 [Elusimicrobia bacterium RIFOXYA1_FULL_47_7]OGS10888.1 MAG: hypothetical protein A2386_06810 [Elusimicrobia bacterium RIFOXYB1_FULL_48_9]OGS15579.1 MAG: hypothetical protein A2251_03500 [Elusimicrobia bacterium RIFOXYA2_FULL_47_53]OGS26865.1 MAG: hypothetical protein A2339_07480 [Elusimicrobia bacterium RIFOXYB12_FULL_50_12]OGS30678.1 MAG: hypothetical protein
MAKLGLYVHVPFCRRKCGYCDFYSIVRDEELVKKYIAAVGREAAEYADIAPGTVFAGGGTPSMLSAEEITDLFNGIFSSLDKRLVKEWTVECNPESLDKDKLLAMKSCGVNRLSIGIQSFNDDELRYLGRVHDSEQAIRAYNLARERGFNNISCDLIYGLPGQDKDLWKRNLSAAVKLGFEHISIYPLTVEPGTALFEKALTVDDELQAGLYTWSMDFLLKSGYGQYEISNWSRPGFECAHNINYWENGEYIGLGPAAASHLDFLRSKNEPDINKYVQGAVQKVECERLEPDAKLGENIMLGLRCEKGVVITPRIKELYGSAIDKLYGEGLVQISADLISLTSKGKLLANRVFGEFI